MCYYRYKFLRIYMFFRKSMFLLFNTDSCVFKKKDAIRVKG